MTAVAVAPTVAAPRRPRTRREVGAQPTTTAPQIRRAHPSARSRRPSGVPAPTLSRGARPEHLRPVVDLQPRCAPTASRWQLTDRAIGLILALVTLFMLTSLAVVVAKAIQVTGPTFSVTATR